MTRVGELAVEIVQMKNDLGDTGAALIEDKKFLADMETNCAKKSAEWETIVKTRNEELLALADTIKACRVVTENHGTLLSCESFYLIGSAIHN